MKPLPVGHAATQSTMLVHAALPRQVVSSLQHTTLRQESQSFDAVDPPHVALGGSVTPRTDVHAVLRIKATGANAPAQCRTVFIGTSPRW